MDGISALRQFVSTACDRIHAERIGAILGTRRGQQRFLEMLPHTLRFQDGHSMPFGSASSIPDGPCFIFFDGAGFAFGEPAGSFKEGLESLGDRSPWLLVSAAGNCGIYQPDDLIDDRVIIRA